MKVIKVRECKDCWDAVTDMHDVKSCMRRFDGQDHRNRPQDGSIPDWCPLEEDSCSKCEAVKTEIERRMMEANDRRKGSDSPSYQRAHWKGAFEVLFSLLDCIDSHEEKKGQ